jgi:hypothetical protein
VIHPRPGGPAATPERNNPVRRKQRREKMKTKLVKTATVKMNRAEAAALLSSVSMALEANGGEAPKSVEAALFKIVEKLNKAFDFGIGEGE